MRIIARIYAKYFLFFISFNPLKNPMDQCIYYCHFTDDETEALRILVQHHIGNYSGAGLLSALEPMLKVTTTI